MKLLLIFLIISIACLIGCDTIPDAPEEPTDRDEQKVQAAATEIDPSDTKENLQNPDASASAETKDQKSPKAASQTETDDTKKDGRPDASAPAKSSEKEERKDPRTENSEPEDETGQDWSSDDESDDEEILRPVVDTAAGTFRGAYLTSLQDHLLEAFVGIPYAQPPVGKLRFAKPEPYPKIEDNIFEASKVAPACIQPKDFDLGYETSEDCLFLNVYRPLSEDEEANDSTKRKKVLVYIHGGAYFVGTGNEYVPGDLVATGNVIVVTMNYRLSWLGFLKGDTPELPGNQGLWDQLMALTWVKKNIRSFGGDPNDITITGNLIGSESVSALSLSPHGKGLFSKAILMSGSLYANPSTNASSDILLEKLAKLVNCDSKDQETDPKDAQEMVKCLRTLPSDAFVLPADFSLRQAFITIDGDLFPHPINEMVQNIHYLGSVGYFSRDYLVSMTNNEGQIFFHGAFGDDTDPDYIDAEFISVFTGLPIPLSESILSWYKEADHSSTKPAYDICGDILMAIPQIKALRTFGSITKAQPPNKLGKQYFMYLNFTPEYIPPPLQGIGHGIDLVYMFDMMPNYILSTYYGIPTETELSPEDLAFRKRYMRIVTDFMKTGKPGTTLAYDAKIKWHSFDKDYEDYLSLEPEPVIRSHPLMQRRRFWGAEFIKGAIKYVNENGTGQLPKDEL